MTEVTNNIKAHSLGSTARERKVAAEKQAVQMLPKLFEAARWGQADNCENIGKEMAQLLGDTHPVIAQKINKHFVGSFRPLKVLQRPDDLVDFGEARHGIDEVILSPSTERECKAIIAEHLRTSELGAFGLSPRHKVLLYGPPGNGKTLLAEGLAKDLELPFLQVKYAGLIESHLGGTGKNLQKIFDYAATAPCVLFMDEFDGVAIDRADSKDVGEIRRVTNQLLILLDRLPSTCVFVAATNANDLLDHAVQRRFDYVLELPAPTNELRRRCVERELAKTLTPGHDVTDQIDSVAALPIANLSGLVKFCQRIRRDLVLNGGANVKAIIDVARTPECE